MQDQIEYVAILRCQTWNNWPATTVFGLSSLQFRFDEGLIVPAELRIVTYLSRSPPDVYTPEDTNCGPIVSDNLVGSFYRVRDSFFLATDDPPKEVVFAYRQTRHGEIDIAISFKLDGDPPDFVVESVRGLAFSVMSLVNLIHEDFLTPAAPFQIQKVLQDGRRQLGSAQKITVEHRRTLNK